jgi:hypothetical protein
MKEHEQKEIERLKKLADELEKNPITIKQRAEAKAEIAAKRKKAAARIADLRLDLEATRIIQKDIDNLKFELAVIDNEREKIMTDIAGKRYFIMTETSGIDSDIRQAENILLQTYDPAIDEAITFFRERRENLLVKNINRQERHGATDIFTEKKEIVVFSNVNGIKEALAYCRAAIDELEGMKLTPDADAERIEALRKGIPDADELREITWQKNMSNDDSPGPGLISAMREATANHIDYLIEKVNEKAQKLLTPKRAGARR